MTAPFAVSLCGYRTKDGKPSTCDASSADSVVWGTALFEELHVPADQPAGDAVGARLEASARDDLTTLRPDLDCASSQQARQFEQYSHLGAFLAFQADYRGPGVALAEALEVIGSLHRVPRAGGFGDW